MKNSKTRLVLNNIDIHLRNNDVRCFITGDEIKDTYIEVFNFTLSGKGIEKVLSEDIDEEEFFITHLLNIWEEHSVCDICEEKETCKFFRLKEDINIQQKICEDCLSVCKNICNEEGPVIRKGDYFLIIEYPYEVEKIDCLNHQKTELRYLLKIPPTGGKNKYIQTEISRIEDMINTLRQKHYNETTFIRESRSDCCVCGKRKENNMSLFFTSICNKCRKEISEDLEEFLNKEKNFIISKVV